MEKKPPRLNHKYMPDRSKAVLRLWAVVKLALAALVVFCPLSAGPADDFVRYFPLRERTAIHDVAGHLLNNPSLPGGVLADYKTCQLFLIRTPSAQKAAFLLLDYKKTLKDPKYLAHMGGYFGIDSGRPAYVFAKGPFLAGVIGLAQDKADPLAREFAARIPLQ
jgi:hypothetical protein